MSTSNLGDSSSRSEDDGAGSQSNDNLPNVPLAGNEPLIETDASLRSGPMTRAEKDAYLYNMFCPRPCQSGGASSSTASSFQPHIATQNATAAAPVTGPSALATFATHSGNSAASLGGSSAFAAATSSSTASAVNAHSAAAPPVGPSASAVAVPSSTLPTANLNSPASLGGPSAAIAALLSAALAGNSGDSLDGLAASTAATPPHLLIIFRMWNDCMLKIWNLDPATCQHQPPSSSAQPLLRKHAGDSRSETAREQLTPASASDLRDSVIMLRDIGQQIVGFLVSHGHQEEAAIVEKWLSEHARLSRNHSIDAALAAIGRCAMQTGRDASSAQAHTSSSHIDDHNYDRSRTDDVSSVRSRSRSSSPRSCRTPRSRSSSACRSVRSRSRSNSPRSCRTPCSDISLLPMPSLPLQQNSRYRGGGGVRSSAAGTDRRRRSAAQYRNYHRGRARCRTPSPNRYTNGDSNRYYRSEEGRSSKAPHRQ